MGVGAARVRGIWGEGGLGAATQREALAMVRLIPLFFFSGGGVWGGLAFRRETLICSAAPLSGPGFPPCPTSLPPLPPTHPTSPPLSPVVNQQSLVKH